jgi:hypothetical protein
LTLTLYPDRVARRLAIIIACLCAASVAAQAVRVMSESRYVQDATQVFKVDRETSIPTYFSALLLLAAAAALGVIAARQAGRPHAAHWRWLAVIFLYLSVDEAAGLHELLMDPTRELLGARGFLFFTWVVPAAALLFVFAAAYWRFWRHLPAPLRRGLAAAGALYVVSAIGIEMLGARMYESFGRMDVRYAVVALAEEAGEMFALVLLLRALLRHLAGDAGAVSIDIGSAAPQTVHARGDRERHNRGRGAGTWPDTSPDAARAREASVDLTR